LRAHVSGRDVIVNRYHPRLATWQLSPRMSDTQSTLEKHTIWDFASSDTDLFTLGRCG
jgi:hypothetical protein